MRPPTAFPPGGFPAPSVRIGSRRWPGRSAPGRDTGSATIYVLAAGGVLLAATGVGCALGAVAAANARAGTAADEAALAAADAVLHRRGDPCARAADIARANGSEVRGCVIDGLDVRIWTATPVGIASVHLGDATARARAGPALRPVP